MSKISVKNDIAVRWMGASFEERSVWIQLFSLVLILGGYFLVAGQMLADGVAVLPPYAAVFGVAVALMIIVMVVAHAAVAIASRPEGRDERDRVIEWRAESNSGWLVGAGVILGICAMIASVPNVWTAHLLLLSLFLSEVVKCVLQLVYYRRGM